MTLSKTMNTLVNVLNEILPWEAALARREDDPKYA